MPQPDNRQLQQDEALRLANVMFSILRRSAAAREEAAFLLQTFELLQHSANNAIRLEHDAKRSQSAAQQAQQILDDATRLLDTYLNDDTRERDDLLRRLERELADADAPNHHADEHPTPC